MNKFLLGTVSMFALASSTFATPSFTGFYVGVSVGGENSSTSYFAQQKNTSDSNNSSSSTSSSEKEFGISKKGFAPRIGAEIGYLYQIGDSFVVGFGVNGKYSMAKEALDSSKDQETTKKKEFFDAWHGKEATGNVQIGTLSLENKPRFVYGAELRLGALVVPNCLIYAGVGVEGLTSKMTINPAVNASDELLKAVNEADTDENKKNAQGNVDNAIKDFAGTAAVDKSFTSIRLVPKVGIMYTISGGVYFGLDLTYSMPLNKAKITDVKASNKEIKSKTRSFGGDLKIGYKF